MVESHDDGIVGTRGLGDVDRHSGARVAMKRRRRRGRRMIRKNRREERRDGEADQRATEDDDADEG
jgi:hypothetical protein